MLRLPEGKSRSSVEPGTSNSSRMSTDELTKCPSCPRMFLSKTGLDFHLLSHRTGEDFLTTALSGNSSTTLAKSPRSPGLPDKASEAHKLESGDEDLSEAPETTAPTTDEKLLEVPKLATNPNSGSGDAVKQFKCDKDFNSSTTLKQHTRTVNEKISRFQSQHCGKCFFSKKNTADPYPGSSREEETFQV